MHQTATALESHPTPDAIELVSTTVLESIPLRLRTLRDIEGVLGSFVVGSRGELLARDVPASCGSQVVATDRLSTAARRAVGCGRFPACGSASRWLRKDEVLSRNHA